jgi:4-hydroxyacetophenone monooxygenase
MNAQAFQRPLEDERLLWESLEATDIAPQLMTVAMLTGDLSLLDEAAPHIQGAWSYMESVPESLRTKTRKALIEALKHHASGGVAPPETASIEFMQRLMSASVGQHVPEQYIPLLKEEMQYDGQDHRVVDWWDSNSPKRAKDFMAVIIGAGFSGICAAVRFVQMGVPFVVLEKNRDIGGTWLENTYPGCAVDTPNHFYSYSFLHNPDWSRHFSKQPEILAYIRSAEEPFKFRQHIRFEKEVEGAHYLESEGKWEIRCKDGEILIANVLVTAVGLLNRPTVPAIPGLSDFEGPSFHTARWDDSVSLEKRRVGVIGTGASAMQAAPAVVSIVDHLTIFQRSPHWAAPSPTYHMNVEPGMRWALRNIPYLNQWARFQTFWAASDGFHATLRLDPEWKRKDRSLNSQNEETRMRLEGHIKAQLEGRPDLIAKCIPPYPPYGRRMLRDNHWYRMLKQPNVTLETDKIEHVDARGIVMHGGARHDLDVLILATGFAANKVLWPLDIRGKGGKTIRGVWGNEDPQAYLGLTVPEFPNLFIVYGPGTNLAHGGSAIFHSECQVRYIQQAIREMIEKNIRTLEVRRDVHDQYVQEFDAEHRNMVWAHPGVTSWYKNSRNRVTLNSPWTLLRYWELTRKFNLADFSGSQSALHAGHSPELSESSSATT